MYCIIKRKPITNMFTGIWYNILRGVAKVAVIINVSQLKVIHVGWQVDCIVYKKSMRHLNLIQLFISYSVVVVWYLFFQLGQIIIITQTCHVALSCLCIENANLFHAHLIHFSVSHLYISTLLHTSPGDLQAFVISFTSDFIPRMVYQYMYSPNGSMHGFVNHTLSHFNVSHFQRGKEPVDPMHLGYPVEICRWGRNTYWFTVKFKIKNTFGTNFTQLREPFTAV